MTEQRQVVGCSKCNRVVWAEDVNTTGRCVFCAGTSSKAADADDESPPEADTEEAESKE